MKRKFKKIALVFFLVFIAIQFYQPKQNVSSSFDIGKNFANNYKVPPKILNSLQKACYDCHSNTTANANSPSKKLNAKANSVRLKIISDPVKCIKQYIVHKLVHWLDSCLYLKIIRLYGFQILIFLIIFFIIVQFI